MYRCIYNYIAILSLLGWEQLSSAGQEKAAGESTGCHAGQEGPNMHRHTHTLTSE